MGQKGLSLQLKFDPTHVEDMAKLTNFSISKWLTVPDGLSADFLANDIVFGMAFEYEDLIRISELLMRGEAFEYGFQAFWFKIEIRGDTCKIKVEDGDRTTTLKTNRESVLKELEKLARQICNYLEGKDWDAQSAEIRHAWRSRIGRDIT